MIGYKGLTKDEILDLMDYEGSFRIHTYSYRDRKVRKIMRDLVREEVIIQVRKEREWIYYKRNKRAQNGSVKSKTKGTGKSKNCSERLGRKGKRFNKKHWFRNANLATRRSTKNSRN